MIGYYDIDGIVLSGTVCRPNDDKWLRKGRKNMERQKRKKKYEKYTLVNRIERVKKFPFIVETTVFQCPVVVQLHGD